MLVELHVHQLGIIDSVTLVFKHGLTAFTGETGAGKTMIIEAIHLLVGGKSDVSMVRHGCDEARVEGRFIVGDDEVILSRVIPVKGRSRAYINGNLATLAQLAEMGADLVDLHGQHAHQSLLHEKAQRVALDQFAGVDTSPVAQVKSELRQLRQELESLGGDERARVREIDLLQFQIDEINIASISSGAEDEELRKEEEALGNAESYQAALRGAYAHLSESNTQASTGPTNASDALRSALVLLQGKETFAAVTSRLASLAAELDDAAAVIRDLAEASEEDPERLAEVSARRKALNDLCRKYGPLLGDVLEYGRASAERLTDLLGYERRARELEASIAAANVRVREAEAQVRHKRVDGAPQFAKAVQKHLRLLALPEAVFQVNFAPESEDPAGDAVNFLLSANPGSPPLPLSKVASGGELARVMLALRLVLTQSPPTLIFDEVDAGIGGAAAVAVGKALAAVGKGHQVFVVTHLAQVASQAQQQLGVSKEIIKKVTYARVGELTGAARESEIARMLSGGALTEVAVAHAQELLMHTR